MAAFSPSFTATVDGPTGKIITITDTSPWGGASDDNYPITGCTRRFILKDSLGVTIIDILMGASTLVTTYELTTNKWVEIDFIGTGTPAFTKIQKYGFYRIFQLAYMAMLVKKCGCCVTGVDLCTVDAFLQGAQMAEPIGDGVSFQNNIDTAYAYLTV